MKNLVPEKGPRGKEVFASVHNMGWWCEVPTVMHSVVRGLNVQLGHLEQKVRAMLDKDKESRGEVRALRDSSSPNDLDDYESLPLGSSVDVGWQVKGTY